MARSSGSITLGGAGARWRSRASRARRSSLRATRRRLLNAKRDSRRTEILIDDYFNSGHFNNHLAERTKSDYRKMGDAFRAKFGEVPIKFWHDPRSRKKLRKFRDKLAVASPRQADYMWSFMSAVFSLAVDDGELPVNPCARGGRLYAGTRVDKISSRSRSRPC